MNTPSSRILYFVLLLGFAGSHPLAYSQKSPGKLEEIVDFQKKPLESLRLRSDFGRQSPAEPVLRTVMEVLFAANGELESPLSNVLSLHSNELEAKALLFSHLDRPETSLVLIDSDDDTRGFQPERGESSETNWVFSLVIPSLSDHIYWIVVPKTMAANQVAYVYGFN